jgi:transcriptional regulator with PAS, ATPase and Fis domain
LRHSIETAAPTSLSVLIMGETGTGKELVAQEIHRLSNRDGKLVVVNCAAIPENLVESTLFGHLRGAFTGAASDRPGLFLEANGGTIFLDEVGELNLTQQPKLLRVLEDQHITPVGGSRSRVVDVRVVAATNVALEQAVSDGKFRADLLARLEDWPIYTPALRDRPADVVPLFSSFLKHSNPVSVDAAEALLVYDWPRNVRELDRLARRLSVALPEGQIIELTDLPDAIADNLRDKRDHAEPDAAPKVPLNRESVLAALEQVEGNVTRAAKVLGCGRKTLYRRLSDFAIDPEKFRAEQEAG